MINGNQRALLLLLLNYGNNNIQGITRLQKLLFILKNDYKIDDLFKSSYEFEPYRFGPYSKKLYDDINFLENLGFIGSTPVGETSLAGENEEKLLLTDYLLSSGEEVTNSSEKCFTLTESGRKKAEQIMTKLQQSGVNTAKLISTLREVGAKYSEMNLSSLIHYVYRKYPESAINSELKHLL